MSFQFSAACTRLKMRGVAKNVLMQLAAMANEHGYAWPSIENLCMRTDWSRSAVIEALNFLEAHKVIQRDKSSGRHTKYWVTPENWQGERHTIRGADQSISRTSPPAGRVFNLDAARPQSGQDRSTTRTLIPLNTKESNTPQPPDGGRSGFDEFFRLFPKQVDQDKAREQWDRLAPDEALFAEIMASVLRWRGSEQWERDGGAFIPKPHNWLRNKGWRNIPGISPLPPMPAPAIQPRIPPATMPASVVEVAARLIGSQAKSKAVRTFAMNTRKVMDGTN